MSVARFHDAQKRNLLSSISKLNAPHPGDRYLARLHSRMGMRTGDYRESVQ
jgi:hypothetical protein